MPEEMFTTLPTKSIQDLLGALSAFVMPDVKRGAMEELGLHDEEDFTRTLIRSSEALILQMVDDISSGRAESFAAKVHSSSGKDVVWDAETIEISAMELMKVTAIAMEHYATIRDATPCDEKLLEAVFNVIDPIVAIISLHGQLLGTDLGHPFGTGFGSGGDS